MNSNPELNQNYSRDAEERLRQIDALDLAGSASITDPAWQRWNGSGILGLTRIGEEPQRFKTLTYQEVADKNSGWKLHLNFDADNEASVQAVNDLLTTLKDRQAITTFKIGNGGGKQAGAPGKEATVYVGHRDKADIVAELLEENLSDVLAAPEGDTLRDDIALGQHVMGRFEVKNVDPDFHQYGAKGHPALNQDVTELSHMRMEGRTADEMARFRAESVHRADTLLHTRYGAFYSGSK